jgi:hypothetical protein
MTEQTIEEIMAAIEQPLPPPPPVGMPAFIQIGPLAYRVSEDELERLKADASDGNATYGRINYGQALITLDPDQDPGHKRAAVLHEVLHGCWHLTLGNTDYEEDVILTLTQTLLDTLRRNPQLVAFLMDDL